MKDYFLSPPKNTFKCQFHMLRRNYKETKRSREKLVHTKQLCSSTTHIALGNSALGHLLNCPHTKSLYIIFTIYFLKYSNPTNIALDKYLHPESSNPFQILIIFKKNPIEY